MSLRTEVKMKADQAESKRGPYASRNELKRVLQLDHDLLEQTHQTFPVLWPRDYLDLAKTSPAVAKLGRPEEQELIPDKGDLADPVSDLALRPVPFVVRKHENRVIILTTKKCHFYCRFCFRRAESFRQTPEPTAVDWQRIFTYLESQPAIEEAILSGGDPLTLSDEKLAWIRTRLERSPHLTHWRIHSRAPVHFPQRVTRALVQALKGSLPLRLITHFNHPDELTEASLTAMRRLREQGGFETLNQAVLLAGINDDPETQSRLWQKLADEDIEPYYLHHPDRAPGNASFRVSIERGRDLYQTLQQTTIPLPRYVLDLPDGSGKIPVMRLQQQDGTWTYQHPNGQVSSYQT